MKERDLVAEREAYEERLAICAADDLSVEDCFKAADKQLWDTIRAHQAKAARPARP